LRDLTGKLAHVLQQLGSHHVLVVHGSDGMDEISISAPTFVAELKRGKISEYTVTPEEFGLQSAPVNAIQVTDADSAKAMLLDVFDNQPGAARNIVLLNAGAAIYVAGLAGTLADGVNKAAEIIASGAAKDRLAQLIQASNA
jgi:anthranilate phosphoribosyltransferase